MHSMQKCDRLLWFAVAFFALAAAGSWYLEFETAAIVSSVFFVVAFAALQILDYFDSYRKMLEKGKVIFW